MKFIMIYLRKCEMWCGHFFFSVLDRRHMASLRHILPGKIFAERRHECLHNDTSKILSSVDARVYVYRCMPSLEGLKVLESPLGEEIYIFFFHTFCGTEKKKRGESETMYSNYYVTGMWCIWFFSDFSSIISISKGRTALAFPRKATDKQMLRLCELKGLQCSSETNVVWKKARMRPLENFPFIDEWTANLPIENGWLCISMLNYQRDPDLC